MKSKNIIMTILLLVVCSCMNETAPLVPKGANIQDSPRSIVYNEEQIYESQTDKNTILNSLIHFNQIKKRYILDISEKDALSIGVKLDAYKKAQKRVAQMNEINKEHL